MDRLKIYQLIGYPEHRTLMFASMHFLRKQGILPERRNYRCVYNGELTPELEDPDEVFRKFNLDIPKDFDGHSLSVSDVIVYEKEGKITALYVDSYGFEELDDFCPPTDNNSVENVTEAVKHVLFDGDEADFEFVTWTGEGNSFIIRRDGKEFRISLLEEV